MSYTANILRNNFPRFFPFRKHVRIMAEPGRGTGLGRQGLLLDIGAQANRFVLKRERKQYSRGFRAGYRFVPTQRAWRMDSSGVSGGLESGIGGPCLNFNFGVAGLTGAIHGRRAEGERESPAHFSE